jgi:hypothetical protein
MGVLSNEDTQMTISSTLYSCRTDEWPTPRSFFAKLNAEFKFTLDPCASAQNTTCPTFFTKEQDGLKQDWERHRVFCNPPYGKTMREWARKCCQASQLGRSSSYSLMRGLIPDGSTIGYMARRMKFASCAAGSNLATARNQHRSLRWSQSFCPAVERY